MTKVGELIRQNKIDDSHPWLSGQNELFTDGIPESLLAIVLESAELLDEIPAKELPSEFDDFGSIQFWKLANNHILEICKDSQEYFYYSPADWAKIEEYE